VNSLPKLISNKRKQPSCLSVLHVAPLLAKTLCSIGQLIKRKKHYLASLEMLIPLLTLSELNSSIRMKINYSFLFCHFRYFYDLMVLSE
jgi:hypothetical protein